MSIDLLIERAGSKTYPRVGWLRDEELRVMLASGHDLHVAHHFIGRGIGYNMSLAVRPPIPRNPFTGSETEDLCTKCGLIVTGYK